MPSVVAMMDVAYAPIIASLSASTASGSSSGSSATSGSVSALVTGGSGQRSYSWTPSSGGITANSPSAASTSFSATGLGIGESRSGSFTLTMTDVVTMETVTVGTVSVYLVRDTPALSASTSGSCVGSVSSYAPAAVYTSYITIIPEGGIAPYTVTFAKTGPPGDTCSVEPSGNSARFANTLGPSQSASPTARATITDYIGQVTYVDFGGSLSNTSPPMPPLSASASGADGFNNAPGVTTPAGSGSPSGGTGIYVSHTWTRLSGIGSANSPNSQSTTWTAFVGFGEYAVDTWRYTVVDSAGNSASATVSVSYSNYGLPPGGFN